MRIWVTFLFSRIVFVCIFVCICLCLQSYREHGWGLMHQKYPSQGTMWNSKIPWLEVLYKALMWESELLITFSHLNREGAEPCPTLMDNATVLLMTRLENLTRISCITSSSQNWHIDILWEFTTITNYWPECRLGPTSLLACCLTVPRIQQTECRAVVLSETACVRQGKCVYNSWQR